MDLASRIDELDPQQWGPQSQAELDRAFKKKMFDAQKTRQLERLQNILQLQKQYPGRRPGGTGPTGLLSTDAKGWSGMLNEQTEAENIQRELAGKGPLDIESIPSEGLPPGIADDPESSFNTSPWSPGGPSMTVRRGQLAGMSPGKEKARARRIFDQSLGWNLG